MPNHEIQFAYMVDTNDVKRVLTQVRQAMDRLVENPTRNICCTLVKQAEADIMQTARILREVVK